MKVVRVCCYSRYEIMLAIWIADIQLVKFLIG